MTPVGDRFILSVKQPDGKMAEHSQQIPLPGILDKYLVFTELNKGGMANVFLGQRLDAPDWVAIKALRPKLALEPRFVEMFSAEGELGTVLNHPNIARTHRLAKTTRNGLVVHFLVMEYVHGRDMGAVAANLRRANARMSPQQALYVADGVLQALSYAHELTDELGKELNVVNKDVSPPNIMADFNGHVKLIDFGIAQATLDYRSQIGSIKGKLRYMSPEQVRGHAVDARSDLFSLSVVLYQLITGTEPFAGETDFEQMQKVRNAEVVSPLELNPKIGPALDAILLQGLGKAPADRFASAGEMLDAVRQVRLQLPPYEATEMAAFMRSSFRREIVAIRTKVEHAQASLKAALSGGVLGMPLGADLDANTSELLDRTLDSTDVDALVPFDRKATFDQVGVTIDGPATRGDVGDLDTRPVDPGHVRVRVGPAPPSSPPLVPARQIIVERAPAEPPALAPQAPPVPMSKPAPTWARVVLALLGLAILALGGVLMFKLVWG